MFKKPEPALVVGAILAVVRLLVGLEVIGDPNFEDGDVRTLTTFIDVALGLAGALFVRQRVSPVKDNGLV